MKNVRKSESNNLPTQIKILSRAIPANYDEKNEENVKRTYACAYNQIRARFCLFFIYSSSLISIHIGIRKIKAERKMIPKDNLARRTNSTDGT